MTTLMVEKEEKYHDHSVVTVIIEEVLLQVLENFPSYFIKGIIMLATNALL